ncbi:MAG: ATP synthase F1 subunit epsilon [Thermoguttaceae bacterium]|nr:ATP synthase F1 subunit epsilon [Thermoguttaceae bacterium]
MKCIVVTPEKTVLEKDASFVALPLFDGEYGVDTNHSPIVGRLGAGEMRLKFDDGSVERWYVEGGFVEVANNVVSLLTNRACELSQLDLEESKKALVVAQARPSNTPELMEIKAKAVDLARAQVRAAEIAARFK